SERTEAFFTFDLAPQEHRTLIVTLRVDERPTDAAPPASAPPVGTRAEAEAAADHAAGVLLKAFAQARDCDHAFKAALDRSIADLALLQVERDGRRFTAAGLPWFLALFGRDSLIPAIQALAFNPDISVDTPLALAHWQGTKNDERTREQPGKILHELRVGELAHLKKVSQTPDYSSVDSTLLFLIVIARHAEWTGSLEGFDALRPNIDRALGWMEAREAESERGYIEYHGVTKEGGPVNQSWRDSETGVLRADGAFPEPPLALVEVQGYAFQARTLLAGLLRRRGETDAAQKMEARALETMERFERDFWMEDEGCYCLALEKGGRQVASVSSNAAQVLWTGIASPDRARRVAERVMRDDMFSGWGVRTLSSGHPRFDPLAYQQGSVWAFDNSLIVSGLRRYGLDEAAARIVQATLDAAHSFRDERLPEFISGIGRKPGALPTKTPRADPLQAWSAGAIPFMLTELLGLRAEGFERRLRVRQPMLPPGVDTLRLDGVRVAGATVSLSFRRRDDRAEASVLEQSGKLEVAIDR
ncbi:MAG: amylo-alpha-1,6-glucosidase, partial [Caulobacteraceae bacterium]